MTVPGFTDPGRYQAGSIKKAIAKSHKKNLLDRLRSRDNNKLTDPQHYKKGLGGGPGPYWGRARSILGPSACST